MKSGRLNQSRNHERYVEEAIDWYRQAAQDGEPGAWCALGRIYEEGKDVPVNILEAMACYENAMAAKEVDGCNYMADLYYIGKDVPQDYARAVKLFTYAYEKFGNSYGIGKMARCYLEGWGVLPDYEKAYSYASPYAQDPICLYVMGRLYCEGLGVAENIAAGVAYYQKAGDYSAAKEELAKYEKTFLGKWVRR